MKKYFIYKKGDRVKVAEWDIDEERMLLETVQYLSDNDGYTFFAVVEGENDTEAQRNLERGEKILYTV